VGVLDSIVAFGARPTIGRGADELGHHRSAEASAAR